LTAESYGGFSSTGSPPVTEVIESELIERVRVSDGSSGGKIFAIAGDALAVHRR
jgi:hypothetical protein